MRPSAVAAVCAALLLGALGGCADTPAQPGGAVASVDQATDVRTDRAPIASRFPRLGEFRAVHWVSGRLGDDRVPGPSTYFIEAVVELAPADAAALAARYPAAAAPTAPQAPPVLATFVPGGPWTRSTALEDGFGPQGWQTTVRIAPDHAVAYVSAVGE
jgi:hypothetical protein